MRSHLQLGCPRRTNNVKFYEFGGFNKARDSKCLAFHASLVFNCVTQTRLLFLNTSVLSEHLSSINNCMWCLANQIECRVDLLLPVSRAHLIMGPQSVLSSESLIIGVTLGPQIQGQGDWDGNGLLNIIQRGRNPIQNFLNVDVLLDEVTFEPPRLGLSWSMFQTSTLVRTTM